MRKRSHSSEKGLLENTLTAQVKEPASEEKKPEQASTKVSPLLQNFSSAKHKLYMRMVMRMSEKFGTDSATLKVIKNTLQQQLSKSSFINATVSFNIIL